MSVNNTIEYGEGYEAYEASRSQHTNPYLRQSSTWRRWNTGWLEAKDDYQDQDVVKPELTGNPILDAAVEVSSHE
jgi:ribosome modulation factor